jgi:hypothetical protein
VWLWWALLTVIIAQIAVRTKRVNGIVGQLFVSTVHARLLQLGSARCKILPDSMVALRSDGGEMDLSVPENIAGKPRRLAAPGTH